MLICTDIIGTTLILIATNAFDAYKSATGAVLDNRTGLLRLTTTQFNNLKDLTFVIGGVCILSCSFGVEMFIYLLFFDQTSFVLTPNGQIWPRNLNADIGGVASDVYLIVGNIGRNSGSGLDFVNGQTFLERFYAVFDTANKRVGIATTSFTDATTN